MMQPPESALVITAQALPEQPLPNKLVGTATRKTIATVKESLRIRLL